MVAGLLQAARRVAKVDIGYAKEAKRVDVRELKRSMWEFLGAAAEKAVHAPPPPPAAAPSRLRGPPPPPPSAPLASFQDAISAVSPAMSSAVTVPFYFVCLLHLANEHSLQVRVRPRGAALCMRV